MQAILVFSHGSVLCGAERNLVEIVDRLRQRRAAPIVELGFLNYNEPLFLDAVNRCVARGATQIVIAPWFLIAGKFIVSDLPKLLEAARSAHPSIEFVVGDVIGFHPALADAILASAAAAKPTSDWKAVIHQTAEWCRDNPKCPLHATEYCRAHQRIPAHHEVPL